MTSSNFSETQTELQNHGQKDRLIDRVVISENFKINGESCKKKHASETEPVKKGHDMDQGLCFQYYNPKILNYISSRI